MRKAVGYNMSSFANSPVNGLLYLRGSLGAPLKACIMTLCTWLCFKTELESSPRDLILRR